VAVGLQVSPLPWGCRASSLPSLSRWQGIYNYITCLIVHTSSIQVFDANTAYVPQGAGVMVNINGGRAMEFLDPPTYARFVEQGIRPRGLLSFDEHGNKVREFLPPSADTNIQQYGVSQVLLPWCVGVP
jgi:hypothetical protein